MAHMTKLPSESSHPTITQLLTVYYAIQPHGQNATGPFIPCPSVAIRTRLQLLFPISSMAHLDFVSNNQNYVVDFGDKGALALPPKKQLIIGLVLNSYPYCCGINNGIVYSYLHGCTYKVTKSFLQYLQSFTELYIQKPRRFPWPQRRRCPHYPQRGRFHARLFFRVSRIA